MNSATIPNPPALTNAIDPRWGSALGRHGYGFQVLPDALLKHQGELKLGNGELSVLLHVLMHWWKSRPDELPRPRPELIAARMAVSKRSVERYLDRLEELGLLRRGPWERAYGESGPKVRYFDPTGLVAALSKIVNEAETRATAEDFQRLPTYDEDVLQQLGAPKQIAVVPHYGILNPQRESTGRALALPNKTRK